MNDTPRRYYGGERVQAPIHQLAATSFKELLERYYNVQVEIPYSREEFFKLDKDTQNTVKDGPYVTGCTFKPGTTKRCDANAEFYTICFIDIDPPADGETDYAKQFFSAPETVENSLYPYNFILHTTARHTLKRPRLRIAVELEEMDPSMQRAVVTHITRDLLGMAAGWKGFRESNVLSQPMYRPVRFLDHKGHSVFASRTGGKAMDEMSVPEMVMDETARDYAYKGTSESSGLAFMPIPDLKVNSVREAMDKIDPDVDYKEWCEVASALRHQFRDESDAEDAYLAFDLWSSRGSKYKGEDETYAKWRSFRPDASGKNPITVRTLFHLAMKAGWSNKKVSTEIQQSFKQWLDDNNSAEDIIAHGAERIAAMPFKDEMVESMMISLLKTRLVSLNAPGIETAAVKKSIRQARNEKRAEEDLGNIPEWLRPWVFVAEGNAFFNTSNNVLMSPDAFNNSFSSNLMASEPGEADAGMGRPSILPQHYALNIKKIRRVQDIAYDPRHGGIEPFFTFRGIDYLNSYRMTALPQEDPKNSAKAGEIFSNHIAKLVGTEYAPLVIDFLCHVVQHPGVLIRWCVYIQSGEGAGKSILKDLMDGVLGKGNAKAINAEILKSQWNDWQTDAVFCVMDEMHIPGDRSESIMNNLKQFVSDAEIPINKRNTSARSNVPNLMNKIAFTNYKNGLHIKDSDRRYCVIESPLQTKEQIDALVNAGHFKTLAKLFGAYAGALRHWMLNHVIAPDFPVNGPAPVTIYRQELIEDGKNRLLTRIEELIADEEEPLIGEDVIHMARLQDLTVVECRNNAAPHKFLRDMGFSRYARDGQTKFFVAGSRTTLWTHDLKHEDTFCFAEDVLKERILKNVQEID